MTVRTAITDITDPALYRAGVPHDVFDDPFRFDASARSSAPVQRYGGTVVAVGDGVAVPIGTRAMGVTSFTDGRGGFAEEIILRADALFPLPDTMDDAEAAVFRTPFPSRSCPRPSTRSRPVSPSGRRCC